MGRHTLRLREATRAPRRSLGDLRRHRGRRHRSRDGARPLLSRAGAAGRRRRLPVRHRLGHGAVVGRPARDPGRQLPQRHAARADGAVGQPPGAGAAAGPGRPAPAGAAHRAGRGRLRLQRGAPGGGRIRADGRDLAVGRPAGRGSHALPPPSAPAASAPRRGARWLAVGRVSPNKALENTIAALAVARAHGDPERDAAADRQAGHRLLCGRTAPLRGRARPGRRRAVRRPCQRCHRGGGLRAAPTCWS